MPDDLLHHVFGPQPYSAQWLVWAVLFQAAVHVDSPRGFTSK